MFLEKDVIGSIVGDHVHYGCFLLEYPSSWSSTMLAPGSCVLRNDLCRSLHLPLLHYPKWTVSFAYGIINTILVRVLAGSGYAFPPEGIPPPWRLVTVG